MWREAEEDESGEEGGGGDHAVGEGKCCPGALINLAICLETGCIFVS